MMPQLSIDVNISPDVINAIQTILDIFASKLYKISNKFNNQFIYSVCFIYWAEEKRDRDHLLDRIQLLETEREEHLQKRNVECPCDCSLARDLANQRKRIKTEYENEVYTNYDTSKDELNAAFHSTSIEDDVVEPSQCQPYQSDSNKSKKITPFHGGHCFNEQNKENLNKCNLKANEKSPTVLSKNSKKVDVNII